MSKVDPKILSYQSFIRFIAAPFQARAFTFLFFFQTMKGKALSSLAIALI